jgi:hypothetical protein
MILHAYMHPLALDAPCSFLHACLVCAGGAVVRMHAEGDGATNQQHILVPALPCYIAGGCAVNGTTSYQPS